MELTYRLSGAMIHLGGQAKNYDQGYALAQKMISSGSAWEKFLEIAAAQGGDISYLKNPNKYNEARYQEDYTASRAGWIESIDALEVGLCAIQLGAGRQKTSDKIDPAAGIVFHVTVGEKVNPGDRIFTVHSDRKNIISTVIDRLKNAISIGEKKVRKRPVVLNTLNKHNIS